MLTQVSPSLSQNYQQTTTSLFRARADTRVKSTMSLNATSNRNLTEHVTAAVRNDLQKNTYLVNREDFLQRFFPSDDDAVRRTYNALVSDKSYVDGRWALLPETPGKQESAYYKPFALILNRICQEYEKCTRVDNINCAKTRRVWLDRHSKNPASVTRAASNRPDIVNLFIDEAQLDEFTNELESSIKELEKQEQTKDTAAASTSRRSKDDPDPKASEHAERILAYWLRIAAVVEIKTKKSDMTSKEYQDTLEQLAGYLRQMFREQHDRMFVFGLILFHDSLSLWYCDRSGLLGVDRFIDINQEPELFIRVIGRLSTMSPTELGWDPTMKVYSSDGQHAYSHSLETDGVLKNFVRSTYLYRTRWVIKINGEEYVTIRALSLSRAEVMCGRGQLIWVAVKKKTRQVVVIKQSWSPFPTFGASKHEDDPIPTEEHDLTIRSEASVYHHAHSNPDEDMKIGRLIAHEEVANTRTFRDFRRGIQHIPRDRTHQPTSAKRDAEGELKDEIVHISAVQWFQERFVPPEQFTERQLSRIVLKDYGYPLKRFRSLHELVQSIEDCLEAYQDLLQNGILHRDLSPGNCLICPKTMLAHSESPQNQFQSLETVGRLIDLDHAKVDKGHNPREAVAKALDRVAPAEEEIQRLIDNVKADFGLVVNADVSKSLYVLPIPITDVSWTVGKAVAYAEAIVESFRCEGATTRLNLEAGKLTLEGLRLVHWQTPLPPRFQNREPENAERSGTIPYMSHVLLNEEPIPHTAVHDMESMFWVLLYLCLTRKGPGGDLRDELFDQPSPLEKSTQDLLLVLYFFYDSPTQVIQNNKNTLFKNPKDLDPHILRHIHPYFNDVKPILLEWWRILCLGFKRCNDAETIEYLYTPRLFQSVTSKWLQDCPSKVESEEPYIAMMNKEEMRRRKDQMEILKHVADICGPDKRETDVDTAMDTDNNTDVGAIKPPFDSPPRNNVPNPEVRLYK
ncbi:hypothetical protein K435DRAFT_853845 [Dendrothele bispora CBS 962.96]|uniref:Fungal-type protein kinase domain-containing protein n=1 Tax=Dendrothele bispora (strain CBS 962.96) TaxID=1314807 RepID=A0A4S8MFN3_DENBC|nr:hypothetical protein K435DRAFT_853845 [Dendrothele bispora CBS 962.96]